MGNRVSLLRVTTLTIANGADTSDAVDMSKHVITGIEFPAALTGTGLTFTVGPTETGTFVASTVAAITKTNSSLVQVGTTYRALEGLGPWVKVKSSGNEGAARTIKIYSVPMAT